MLSKREILHHPQGYQDQILGARVLMFGHSQELWPQGPVPETGIAKAKSEERIS